MKYSVLPDGSLLFTHTMIDPIKGQSTVSKEQARELALMVLSSYVTDNFRDKIQKLYETAESIFWRKNADYGTDNIARMGPLGTLSRLQDKVSRAKNILESGAAPNNEGLLDTALDIANYGIILASLLDGSWPSEEATRKLRVMGSGISAPKKRGDVGFDLTAHERVVLWSGEITWVPVDARILCPPGTWARVSGRSSMSMKRRILVVDNVIDPEYTGLLQVGCIFFGGSPAEKCIVEPGDRIAQLTFYKGVVPQVEVVAELPSTERGDTGFGSTGQ